KRTDQQNELLFSDGVCFYEPITRFRFDTDTLEEGRHVSYGHSLLLVEVNLHPRQMLGNKALHLLGDVTIEGVKYQQLRATLWREQMQTKTRLYAEEKSDAARVARIDYYYDSARSAIGRMVVSYTGNELQ